DAVHFLGEIDAAGKCALFAAADVLACCSDSESFGLSIAEALGAGVPAVVRDTCPWAVLKEIGAGDWDSDIWSGLVDVLADRERALPAGVTSFFAGGRKRRFLHQGLRRAVRPPDLVFCTHLNVAPVALPMTLLGTRLVVSLLGVEAWRPVRVRERLALRQTE